MSLVRIYCQDGHFQTEITLDQPNQTPAQQWANGINYGYPSGVAPTQWSISQNRQEGCCSVVALTKGYQHFQVAVYATTQAAENAVKEFRSFMEEWRDKPAPPDNLPKFQFPPNTELINALPLIKRLIKHDGQ